MRKQRSSSGMAWAALGVLAGVAGVILGLALLTPPRPPAVPPEVSEFVRIDAEIAQAQADRVTHGWVRDDLAVAAFSATLKTPRFAATPAGLAADPLPKSVFLWDGYVKKFGRPFPVMDQNPIGSCVGFGTSRAYEYSLVNEVAAGQPFEFHHIVEEVTYGGSRHEIGGDRIRGDGSVGAWAAQFVTKYGGLPRGVYLGGKYVLDKYSPTRCRQWGQSGVPDDLEPEVKKYPAGGATAIRSKEELMRALANGYAVAECSNFLIGQDRDQNGVVGYGGAGGHCMCINGYNQADDGVYFHIENSWGPDYHRGPVGWGSPNTSGGWLHERYVIRYMLSGGDTWAISAVTGFPAKLDWFEAQRPNRARPGVAAIALAF